MYYRHNYLQYNWYGCDWQRSLLLAISPKEQSRQPFNKKLICAQKILCVLKGARSWGLGLRNG